MAHLCSYADGRERVHRNEWQKLGAVPSSGPPVSALAPLANEVRLLFASEERNQNEISSRAGRMNAPCFLIYGGLEVLAEKRPFVQSLWLTNYRSRRPGAAHRVDVV